MIDLPKVFGPNVYANELCVYVATPLEQMGLFPDVKTAFEGAFNYLCTLMPSPGSKIFPLLF